MLDAGHDLSLRRLGIAVALHQLIEKKAVLINGAPKPVFLSLDSDDNLIKVPFVPEPGGGSLPDIIGKVPTEFLSSKSNGLMRDDDATRCQHILDHPQAQRKPEIQPNGMVARPSTAI